MENKQFARTTGGLERIETSLYDWAKHNFSLSTVTKHLCYLSQQPDAHAQHGMFIQQFAFDMQNRFHSNKCQ